MYLNNLIKHDQPFDQHYCHISFRWIDDICSCLYRLLVIALCIRFVVEFLFGKMTEEEIEDHGINTEKHKGIKKMICRRRSACDLSFWEQMTYLFKGLDLDPLTITAVLCEAHQLCDAVFIRNM